MHFFQTNSEKKVLEPINTHIYTFTPSSNDQNLYLFTLDGQFTFYKPSFFDSVPFSFQKMATWNWQLATFFLKNILNFEKCQYLAKFLSYVKIIACLLKKFASHRHPFLPRGWKLATWNFFSKKYFERRQMSKLFYFCQKSLQVTDIRSPFL